MGGLGVAAHVMMPRSLPAPPPTTLERDRPCSPQRHDRHDHAGPELLPAADPRRRRWSEPSPCCGTTWRRWSIRMSIASTLSDRMSPRQGGPALHPDGPRADPGAGGGGPAALRPPAGGGRRLQPAERRQAGPLHLPVPQAPSAMQDLTIDHVIPRRAGEPESWTNCTAPAGACNVARKAGTDPDQAGMPPQASRPRPDWKPPHVFVSRPCAPPRELGQVPRPGPSAHPGLT